MADAADGSLPDPVPPKANLPDVRPGSIQPLLERSRIMVEIKGVTLNKSQVWRDCRIELWSARLDDVVTCNPRVFVSYIERVG